MVLNGLSDQAVKLSTKRLPTSPRKLPAAKRMFTTSESRLLSILDGVIQKENASTSIPFNVGQESRTGGSRWPPFRVHKSGDLAKEATILNNERLGQTQDAPHPQATTATIRNIRKDKGKEKTLPTSPRLPLYSYRKFTPQPKVKYLRSIAETNELVKALKGPLGFDMEWRVNFKRGGSEFKTAVVQICDQENILVVQLSAMKAVPSALQDVIESPSILKLGANILNDGYKLYRDYGVKAQGFLELGTLALAADPEFIQKFPSKASKVAPPASVDTRAQSSNEERTTPTPPRTARSSSSPKQCIVSLASITAVYTGKHLDKGPARCSNWEKQPLTEGQLEYASNDAHCAVRIYYRLVELAEAAGLELDVKSLTRSVYTSTTHAEAGTRAEASNVSVSFNTCQTSNSTPKPLSAGVSSIFSALQISRQSSSASCDSVTSSSAVSVSGASVTSTTSATGAASVQPAQACVKTKPTSTAKNQPICQRPQHIRAYNLWHHKRVDLDEMCATLRLAKAGDAKSSEPLKRGTVITYIVTALQVDPTLPFDRDELKKLVARDSASGKRHAEWMQKVLAEGVDVDVRDGKTPETADVGAKTGATDSNASAELLDQWKGGAQLAKVMTMVVRGAENSTASIITKYEIKPATMICEDGAIEILD